MAIEMARDRRGHFNIIHNPTSLKADFYIANKDELHAWAFCHAKGYSIDSTPIQLAPPEYEMLHANRAKRKGRRFRLFRDGDTLQSGSVHEAPFIFFQSCLGFVHIAWPSGQA
jgi:hypothetical protein